MSRLSRRALSHARLTACLCHGLLLPRAISGHVLWLREGSGKQLWTWAGSDQWTYPVARRHDCGQGLHFTRRLERMPTWLSFHIVFQAQTVEFNALMG